MARLKRPTKAEAEQSAFERLEQAALAYADADSEDNAVYEQLRTTLLERFHARACPLYREGWKEMAEFHSLNADSFEQAKFVSACVAMMVAEQPAAKIFGWGGVSRILSDARGDASKTSHLRIVAPQP